MYLSHVSPELVQAAQALDLAKMADLKNLRDRYFDCLLVCTGLVGIGLLMEAPELWYDVREAIGRKSRELKYWLTPSIDREEYPIPPPRVKVLAAVGWVLIVLGVMGEGVSEGFVHKYDTALSSLNDAIIAETQKEAGFALERASANELEAERLRRQLAPRTLDDASRRAIGKELSKFAPRFSGRKIEVMSYVADAEGIVFSLEVADIITKASIEVDPVIGRVEPVGLVDMGLKITDPSGDKEFMRSLAASIHSHLDTEINVEWNPKYTGVMVLVGVKPVAGLPVVKRKDK
jgi:hypothetical protein